MMHPESQGSPDRSPILLYVASEDRAFVSHRLPMARAARDAGFAVHVATAAGPEISRICSEGFAIELVSFRRGSASIVAAIATIISLRSVLRRLSPQLIHCSGLQTCVLGGLAATGLGIPQIHALTGMGFLFTSQSIKAKLLKAPIALLLRVLLNSGRNIALVQNPDDAAALRNIGVKASRITFIPGSGVDTDRLQPLPEPDGPITVGFAGRLLRDKGIHTLVEAHGIVQSRGLTTRLLIAGEPDAANPASFAKSDIDAWLRVPRVEWLGQIGNIIELWRQSHIAALPSHREGLPKTLLEAAAFGRPMIATDVPGCREITIDRETGILVPLDDASKLADAIEELARSVDLRRRYGDAGRQLVERKMSDRAVGESIVALYRNVLRAIAAKDSDRD